MRAHRHRRWRFDEDFVDPNGDRYDLCRTIDREGEIRGVWSGPDGAGS
jgi:transposase-like protein